MAKGLAFMVRYIEFHGDAKPMEIITEHDDECSARKSADSMKKKYKIGDILVYKRIELSDDKDEEA